MDDCDLCPTMPPEIQDIFENWEFSFNVNAKRCVEYARLLLERWKRQYCSFMWLQEWRKSVCNPHEMLIFKKCRNSALPHLSNGVPD